MVASSERVPSFARCLLHYALLAVVLLGVPWGCAWLGGHEDILAGVTNFPPRTEDWGTRPELLWNHRCPFSWIVFAGFGLFALVNVWPFLRRAWRAAWAAAGVERPRERFPFPWWGWLGLGVLAAGWTLSWTRFDWFRPYQVLCSYFPIWLGFILVMNALCVRRSGTSPLTAHPVAYLASFPVSSLFWWFFEYLNRYVWNWYYVGVGELSAAEYVVYATLCFSSVLPAVAAVAAWLRTFPAFSDAVYQDMARIDLRRPAGMAFLFGVAAVGLTGIVFFPAWSYPLLWMSPLTAFVFIQHVLREPSVTDRFRLGDWSIYFRFAVASLICGFCWETWNYYALAKWIYAVPWVHRFQIWEMPLLGFAGYLPFGVECAVVTAWISPGLIGWEGARK